MLFGKPPPGKRWPRGQKFTLSPVGTEAQGAYHAAVASARASGRAALEAALAGWAAPRGVAPADGAILSELAGKRLGLGALCEALEATGIAPDEVRAGIGRLVEAGIVEPLPPASREAR
jgi:DNA-binding transcriptional ArsR family regulator